MAAPVALRSDYDGKALRRLAKASKDADQTRRLLALAVVYDGGSRGDAGEIGGVGLQTVRDWVLRFNAAGPDGLVNGKAPGGRPVLGEVERAAASTGISRTRISAACSNSNVNRLPGRVHGTATRLTP